MKPEPFDPTLHARAVRDRPQDFVTMVSIAMDAAQIRAIKQTTTLEALNKAFQVPAKAAKAAGDTELLRWLTEAKDARKGELTA